MNWSKLISELLESMTFQQIADATTLSGKGHAHDLLTGRQKSVSYETGLSLIALHKKVMRKKAKHQP